MEAINVQNTQMSTRTAEWPGAM